MLRNYLLIIWRTFRRQPLYPLLNLSGLVISIAAALIILLYIQFELNYDRFHAKGERIYRVTTPTVVTHEKSMEVGWQGTHGLLGLYAQQDYPEVEAFVRVFQFFADGAVNFEYGGKTIHEEAVYAVDSNALEIFSFELLNGNQSTALSGPNKVIISQSLATRVFGEENPLGKTLSATITHRYPNPQTDYLLEVSGVFKDTPKNTHLNTHALISAATDPELDNYYFNDFAFYTYLLLKPHADPDVLAGKLSGMYSTYMDAEREPVMKEALHALLPLWSIHMQGTQGMIYIYIFGGIALLLLLIAGISYVNMATAQSSRRALEVGLRKVLGSTRGTLVRQFLSESLVFTLLSIALAVVLVRHTLEPLNNAIGLQLSTTGLWEPMLLIGMMGIVVLLGLLGGSYPAFFLSSFEPITVIKGQINKGGKHHLRKVLVGVQLAVVIFVLACTGLIYDQMAYIRHKDLGFNQEQVVMLQLPDGVNVSEGQVLKEQLLQQPAIQAVTFSSFIPGVGGMVRGPIDAETEKGHVHQFVYRANIDYDFLRTMDIDLMAGRNFSREFPTDSTQAVLINQTFVQSFGLENPIGTKIRFGGAGNPHFYRVIGVIEDFHQGSLHNPINSQLFRLRSATNIVVKTGQDLTAGMAGLESAWKQSYPDAPFEYRFLDEVVQQEYEADQIRGNIFSFFAGLTLFVCFLGLFGLASFLAGQRRKEIGIRKVLGASTGNLLFLISRDFILLAGVAAVPAFVLSWYVIQKWLDNFAFRAETNYGLFAIVLLLTLLLTFLTTGGQAIRTARLNPVDTLRSE